jgi:endonuclease G
MAAPRNEFAFDLAASIEAAGRFREAGNPKRDVAAAIAARHYTSLDTPERLAKRVRRLEQQEPVLATRNVLGGADSPGSAALDPEDRRLERVIGNSRDFVYVDFLERARVAARSVARIVTRLSAGRVAYGTGFMVSPRLLLTNQHVLGSAEDALRSVAEFDYERELDGRTRSISSFALRPQEFFLADKAHDFALVAVAESGTRRPLRDFGWCPLFREEGKIVIGEPVNLIQHPKGELKQLTLRENRLLLLRDLHAQYEADTEPGSSGSPVFNNQWEVVALHHAGVPKTNARGELVGTDGKPWRNGDDPARLAWIANEGVRVSRLVAFVERARLTAAAGRLRRVLLDAPIPPASPGEADAAVLPSQALRRPMAAGTAVVGAGDDDGEGGGVLATIELPLRIDIRLGGTADGAIGLAAAVVGDAVPDRDGRTLPGTGDARDGLEAIQPDPSDPEYRRRPGFDRRALGFSVPLPKLGDALLGSAFALSEYRGARRFELRYHRYSVVFNQRRRLAFFAATNYDPRAPVQYGREGDDRWFYDPRVPRELQVGNELYEDNPLDRGHLVRRADAAWGRDEREARLASDDTFHYPNCAPQHEITNRGLVNRAPASLRLWGRLEEHVARQGRRDARPIAIFSGPVFAANDRRYRGVQLPKSFWKLIAYADDGGQPTCAAFVLTQAALIKGLEEEFEVGEYRAVQVRVADLAARVGLNFGPCARWDILARPGAQEAFGDDSGVILIEHLEDLVL